MVDFEIGDRNAKTFKRLWNRIKEINCQVYCTDYLKVYRKFFPPEKHIQSKKETYTVESKNQQIRNYVRRFFRKTKSYSKSKTMIYLGMMMATNKINKLAVTKNKKHLKLI